MLHVREKIPLHQASISFQSNFMEILMWVVRQEIEVVFKQELNGGYGLNLCVCVYVWGVCMRFFRLDKILNILQEKLLWE